MKKLNKILLMIVFGICSFATFTIAKAESFELEQMKLVCEPAAIESGERSTCYLIGKPSPSDATYTNHGYVVQAFTQNQEHNGVKSKLKIVTAKKNDSVPNTDAKIATPTSATTPAFSDATVGTLNKLICKYDAESHAEEGSFRCIVYYSTTETNAFNPAAIKQGVSSLSYMKDYVSDGYGIIGGIVVELEADATANECGELCVKVWQIPDSKGYSEYNGDCAVASPGDPDCGEPTKVQGGSPASTTSPGYFCEEIHLESKPTPEPGEDPPSTGAFTSYAILAAGALIAVSAIAMSKKNNKFNKI